MMTVGNGTLLALLVFDTIDQNKILTSFGDHLSFGALKFLKSYLSDRTQCVQVSGILPETTKFKEMCRRSVTLYQI